MTPGLINACKKKNRLYNVHINSKSPNHEIRYKAYKNRLTKILKRAEKDHYANKLKEYQSNAKMCWKILNEVMNRKRKPQPKPNYFIKDNKEIRGKSNIANILTNSSQI